MTTLLKEKMFATGMIALTILAAGIIILGNQRQANAQSEPLGSQIVCFVYSTLNGIGSPIPVLSASGCEATSTSPSSGTIELIKNVSGTSTPSSDFTIHLSAGKSGETNTPPELGSASGTIYANIPTDTYTVSEDSNTGGVDRSDFTESFDAGCPGGVIVLTDGSSVVCTITNTWVGGSGSGSSTESDLSVTKTVDNPTPNVGADVTYTITVNNAGPADATGVLVTDLLPGGLTYVSDDGGGAYNHTAGLWTIGTMAESSSATLHITAMVGSGTGGETITNIAAATDANGDPNGTNNTGSASITVNSSGGGGGGTTGTLVVKKTFGTGTTTPSQFSFSVNGGAPVAFNANGENDITETAGTYSVTEVATSTYSPTYTNCTLVTVTVGGTTTCIITNNLSSGGGVVGSDISVSKTVDNATPNIGNTVTYTITASDTGMDATGVIVNDSLPSGLTFVSTSSQDTVGVYDPVSGNWTIGDLSSTTPATLHIMATVNSGQSNGTVITNTANVTSGDTSGDSGNNSASAPITVTIPSNNPGGGGGGGGGGSNGPPVGGSPTGGGGGPIPMGQVLGASTSTGPIACTQYLTSFIKLGAKNDPEQVTRLQAFLDQFEGDSLPITGVYDTATYNAVKAFQQKYAGQILTPWGENAPTGYVYLTTRREVNIIYCNYTLQFPLTPAQQAEIQSYKSEVVGGTHVTTGGSTSGHKAGNTTPTNTSNENSAPTGTTQTNPNLNEAGAAAVTQSGGGFWGSIGNFFSKIFHR